MIMLQDIFIGVYVASTVLKDSAIGGSMHYPASVIENDSVKIL